MKIRATPPDPLWHERGKSGLAQRLTRQAEPGAELPEDVRAARDRLIAQQQAVLSAMIEFRDSNFAPSARIPPPRPELALLPANVTLAMVVSSAIS